MAACCFRSFMSSLGLLLIMRLHPEGVVLVALDQAVSDHRLVERLAAP